MTRVRALKFLTRGQLKTRLESGKWVRVHPRVYRVVGAPETWLQRLDALLLWSKHVVLSHRTAAVLHGFKAFREGPVELTSTRRLRVPPGVSVFRVDALRKSDVTELADRKVTSATRTLIDLACATDRFTLRRVFDQALREKKTTLEDLAAAIARSENRPGVIDARNLLREFEGDGGPSESELERYALDLIESAGLPKPEVQKVLAVGNRRRRLDLIFAKLGVVIEVDGYATHSGIDSFEDDRARNNSLVVRNLTVLHWTWNALHERPDELIAELYAALNLRN